MAMRKGLVPFQLTTDFASALETDVLDAAVIAMP